MAIDWKYCECGCKGHEANVGSIHLWLFNDLKGGYFLHRGHGWLSPLIGQYDSRDKAHEAATAILQAEASKLMDALQNVLKPEPKPEPAPTTRFERMSFFVIDGEPAPTPPKGSTVCKHGTGDCTLCGTSTRRDRLHTTEGGVGAVGKLRKQRVPATRKRG